MNVDDNLTPHTDLNGRQDEAVDGAVAKLRAEVAQLRGTVRVLVDTVERTTRKLTDSEARWQCLGKQSLIGIAIVEGTRFARVNARFAETFGYQGDEMLAVPASETVAHSSRLRVTEHLRACLANEPHPRVLEYEGLKKDGSSIYIELSSSRLEKGDGLRAVFVVSDITARKLAEREVHALKRRLAELAVRDPLTGLYNRRFMEASLEQELIQCERDNSPLSVVTCGVDDLGVVNNAFGRQAGDEVLKAFASLLKGRCRQSDIACRYGAGEFLVVFPGMPAEIAAAWAEGIRAPMARARVTRESSSLQVHASFGVATYPEAGESWQELIAAAYAAQHTAKATGGNQVSLASPKAESKSPDLTLLVAREM
jgi:diguanylate cyclase (GGDEF)-like protein/PAS domain S-box-containing protein